MMSTPNTLLAINAGPFERHYTTCHRHKVRHWKIHEGQINRAVPFIFGQVFKPTANIDTGDLKLLPKNARIQYCGNYRCIQLSEYIMDRQEEIFIIFFLSDYYVVHPYRYYTLQTSLADWQTKNASWNKIENFPDLRGQIVISYRPLLRILFFIHACESPQKIP